MFTTRTLIALALVGSALGCAADLERPPEDYEAAESSPQTLCNIDQVLTKNCGGIGCHGSIAPQAAGLDLQSPGVASRLLDAPASHSDLSSDAEALKCAPGELLVDRTNPDNSLILRKVLGTQSCGMKMPLTFGLPSSDLDCLREWVFTLAGKDPGSGGG